MSANTFEQNYQSHLKHLKLKGLQPKTIDVYARAIRRIGKRFDQRIDELSEQQLSDSFTELLASHSWSAVKLDLYGLKFYYAHVLRRSRVAPGLVTPPKSQRLPDIVTVAEAKRIFVATRVVSEVGWKRWSPMFVKILTNGGRAGRNDVPSTRPPISRRETP